jgi:hypothetical protein
MVDPRTLPTSWRDTAALLHPDGGRQPDPTLTGTIEYERLLSLANAYRQCAAELEASLAAFDDSTAYLHGAPTTQPLPHEPAARSSAAGSPPADGAA